MLFRLLLIFVSLAIVFLGLYTCTRHQDRFRPDTEQELIGFIEPRVIQGDPGRLISIELVKGHGGEIEGIRKLNHELKVGDEVVVGISVAVNGEYRSGGGWIFSGRTYYGRHGLSGDLLSFQSSHPEVLAAVQDEHGNLQLKALNAGQSRVTLSATLSRRYADRPDDSPIRRDTVNFKVSR
jgi:hypothetical protein